MTHQMTPYFSTWTKQNSAPTFSASKVHDVTFEVDGIGTVYDLLSINFQAAFGQRHETIKQAIIAQLNTMPLASPKAEYSLKQRATRRLLDFLKLDGKIFYTVSGAEAVENALKMSRQITGRRMVLARKKSYHGATLGALSVTGDWRGEGHFSLSEWTVRIPEPDEDPDLSITRAILKRVGPEQCAAFCLETITGMNGVIVPRLSWWNGIQRLAREFGIMLILDEVSCGFRRTGPNFAFHSYDLQPDFVCMAKTITGGYIPFGAVYASSKCASFYNDCVLSAGLTNYAHPLGLAAMNAVLDLFEDDSFCKNKDELEKTFTAALDQFRLLPAVGSIRRAGLMAAIELKKPSQITWAMALQEGIHVACKDNMIILAPPFVMRPSELNLCFEKLSATLQSTTRGRGDPDRASPLPGREELD